jgi:hypothetical protein
MPHEINMGSPRSDHDGNNSKLRSSARRFNRFFSPVNRPTWPPPKFSIFAVGVFNQRRHRNKHDETVREEEAANLHASLFFICGSPTPGCKRTDFDLRRPRRPKKNNPCRIGGAFYHKLSARPYLALLRVVLFRSVSGGGAFFHS